jgi:hypothetical protein
MPVSGTVIRVDAYYFCAGVEIIDGRVTCVAPILRKTVRVGMSQTAAEQALRARYPRAILTEAPQAQGQGPPSLDDPSRLPDVQVE